MKSLKRNDSVEPTREILGYSSASVYLLCFDRWHGPDYGVRFENNAVKPAAVALTLTRKLVRIQRRSEPAGGQRLGNKGRSQGRHIT